MIRATTKKVLSDHGGSLTSKELQHLTGIKSGKILSAIHGDPTFVVDREVRPAQISLTVHVMAEAKERFDAQPIRGEFVEEEELEPLPEGTIYDDEA